MREATETFLPVIARQMEFAVNLSRESLKDGGKSCVEFHRIIITINTDALNILGWPWVLQL